MGFFGLIPSYLGLKAVAKGWCPCFFGGFCGADIIPTIVRVVVVKRVCCCFNGLRGPDLAVTDRDRI